MRDLRHDRAVANGKSDGTGRWLRTSAWLPPGLALGWLAVLLTFVHGVGNLLAAWAATVSLVVLLAWRRPAAPPAPLSTPATTPDPAPKAHEGGHGPPDREQAGAGGTARQDDAAREGAAADTRDQAEQSGTAEIAVAPGLQVLTAAEVASVLRVDADMIISAISNGELPGNRVGSHWRVDLGALTRWLQGRYGDDQPTERIAGGGRTGLPSSTEPRTGPT